MSSYLEGMLYPFLETYLQKYFNNITREKFILSFAKKKVAVKNLIFN